VFKYLNGKPGPLSLKFNSTQLKNNNNFVCLFNFHFKFVFIIQHTTRQILACPVARQPARSTAELAPPGTQRLASNHLAIRVRRQILALSLTLIAF